MPRQARIDTPGAAHHIIVRGIERRKIFTDDQDREAFIDSSTALNQRPNSPTIEALMRLVYEPKPGAILLTLLYLRSLDLPIAIRNVMSESLATVNLWSESCRKNRKP